MTRGILTSCYARLRNKISAEEIREVYRDFYHDEPFVRVVERPPQAKHTWGSNICLVHHAGPANRKAGGDKLPCDNLMKGGAGQVLQDMNLASRRKGITIYPYSLNTLTRRRGSLPTLSDLRSYFSTNWCCKRRMKEFCGLNSIDL